MVDRLPMSANVPYLYHSFLSILWACVPYQQCSQCVCVGGGGGGEEPESPHLSFLCNPGTERCPRSGGGDWTDGQSVGDRATARWSERGPKESQGVNCWLAGCLRDRMETGGSKQASGGHSGPSPGEGPPKGSPADGEQMAGIGASVTAGPLQEPPGERRGEA